MDCRVVVLLVLCYLHHCQGDELPKPLQELRLRAESKYNYQARVGHGPVITPASRDTAVFPGFANIARESSNTPQGYKHRKSPVGKKRSWTVTKQQVTERSNILRPDQQLLEQWLAEYDARTTNEGL